MATGSRESVGSEGCGALGTGRQQVAFRQQKHQDDTPSQAYALWRQLVYKVILSHKMEPNPQLSQVVVLS